jgi:hypothetical protein
MKLKQQIQKKLGPIFLRKGFVYDELNTKAHHGGFVFGKGDPEPSMEWYMKSINNEEIEMPKREEIIIYKNRFKPEITADLISFLKNPRTITLGEFLGLKRQLWWPISNEEELSQAFKEILEIMDEYGWQWFVLK